MKTLIEYSLEDGDIILVEGSIEEGGVVKASRDRGGNIITRASRPFNDVFPAIKASVTALRAQIDALHAKEVELTFGLTTAGETGLFVIAKGSAEANYVITLKWRPE